MSQEIQNILFKDLAQIIEQGKQQAVAQVNSILTLTYWHVGKKITDHVLNNERAEYGKQIIPVLAQQLEEKFGKSFTLRNIRRMIQFAQEFPDFQIVTPLVTQLSWTHFITLFNVKSDEAKAYYTQKTIEAKWSKRELQHQIERKAFERNEIANTQVHADLTEIQTTFKYPYFLDFLGLKDGFLENDLESAIIRDLESFILEHRCRFFIYRKTKTHYP
jgi:hypothetical protein